MKAPIRISVIFATTTALSALAAPAARAPQEVQPKITRDAVKTVVRTLVPQRDCSGVAPAQQAFAACLERCSESAAAAPITPQELASCGDRSVSDCAAQIVRVRAQACVQNACAEPRRVFDAELKKCRGE